jgi:hypothetical protein
MNPNPLEDKRLLDALIALGESNPDEFARQVLQIFRDNRDLLVDDESPLREKYNAIDKLRFFLEEKSEYEDCAFLRDLYTDLERGEAE